MRPGTLKIESVRSGNNKLYLGTETPLPSQPEIRHIGWATTALASAQDSEQTSPSPIEQRARERLWKRLPVN